MNIKLFLIASPNSTYIVFLKMLNFCKFFFEKTFKKDKKKMREPPLELIFSSPSLWKGKKKQQQFGSNWRKRKQCSFHTSWIGRRADLIENGHTHTSDTV